MGGTAPAWELKGMPSQEVRALPQMFRIRGFHSGGQLSSQTHGSSSRALLSHLTALPNKTVGSALSFQRIEGNYPEDHPILTGLRDAHAHGFVSALAMRQGFRNTPAEKKNPNDNDDVWSGALSVFCKQVQKLAVS